MSTRPKISPEFLLAHKRSRLGNACAEVAAERGLALTRVSDVVTRARVARGTFYEAFTNTEECATWAVTGAVLEALGAVEAGATPCEGRQWSERVSAGLAALLDWIAENTALSRLVLVESLALPLCGEAWRRGQVEFMKFLREGTPELPTDSSRENFIYELLIGGVVSILHRHLRKEPYPVRELHDQLEKFVLAPWEVRA